MMRCVTDMMGRRISLSVIPQRIISLVPSQTELLYDLGLKEEVVGITKFCVHPDVWFNAKEKIGGTKNINFEKISALKPDLIIANKEENVREQVEELANQYPVWISDVNSLKEALQMISEIGELIGKREQASTMASEIDTRFKKLSKKNLGSTAYFIWHNPWMIAASNTFVHDILTQLGYTNAFKHEQRYPSVDEQLLKKLAPLNLFLSSEPFPFKEKHATQLREILPHANLHFVNGEYYSWYGSRLLKALDHFEQSLP